MKKAFQFLSPVAFTLVCALTYGIFALLFQKSIDLLGAVLGLIFGIFFEFGLPIFLSVFVAPVYSVLYGVGLRGSRKTGFLFALYNALVPSLTLAIAFHSKEHVLTYAILLFVWMTLWSAIPLLFPKRTNPTPR